MSGNSSPDLLTLIFLSVNKKTEDSLIIFLLSLSISVVPMCGKADNEKKKLFTMLIDTILRFGIKWFSLEYYFQLQIFHL